MNTQAHRRAVNNWYANRGALHLERAALRGAVLKECGAAIVAAAEAGNLDMVEVFEGLTVTALYTGYDTFAAMASDLGELGPKDLTLKVYAAVPSLAAFIAWLEKADARLGTYPRER